MSNDKSVKDGLSISQTVVIIVLTIVVVCGVGYYVGKTFFWNQYDTSSVYERQLEAVKQYSKENPKSINAKVILFDRYYGLGQYKEARKVLDELIKAVGKNPDIEYREAILLKEEGQKEKALEKIKQAVKDKPFFTSARVAYALILSENKKYDEALKEIDAVLKIMPGASDVYVEQAKIYIAKGDKQKALESVDKALSMVPNYEEALKLKKQIQ